MPTLTSRRALAALIAAAFPLAACGSSGSSSSGSPGANAAAPANYNRSLQFAHCMRTHGVPDFPDPKANGSGGMEVEKTPGSTKVNGVSVNGPAFQSAMQACRSQLPNGGHPPPLTAARKAAMLKYSQCMRAHGLTNFPDPTFGSGGQAQLLFHAAGGLDPNSPEFKQ